MSVNKPNTNWFLLPIVRKTLMFSALYTSISVFFLILVTVMFNSNIGFNEQTTISKTTFMILFVLIGISVISQWYLWISMIVFCYKSKKVGALWLLFVIFGLSWAATVFYFTKFKKLTSVLSTTTT